MFIALLALAFITALLAMVAYAHAQPVSSTDIRVIDGDTIALTGLSQHVRLVGFNAPETRNAECQPEAQIGERAKQRLTRLLRGGELDLTLVPCSREPGTEGTPRCNHGRRCGALTIDGRDIGGNPYFRGFGSSVPLWKDEVPTDTAPMVRVEGTAASLLQAETPGANGGDVHK